MSYLSLGIFKNSQKVQEAPMATPHASVSTSFREVDIACCLAEVIAEVGIASQLNNLFCRLYIINK